MGKDYYKILGVDKDCKDDELKKAYRRLAIKWHPDKRPEAERAAAEEKFKEIAEAYDVLSDPQKRQVFDAYGEEGLKGGAPPPDAQQQPHGRPGGFGDGAAAGGAPGSFSFSFGGPGGRGGYSGVDAARAANIFAHLFGHDGDSFAFFPGGGAPGGGRSRVRMFSRRGSEHPGMFGDAAGFGHGWDGGGGGARPAGSGTHGYAFAHDGYDDVDPSTMSDGVLDRKPRKRSIELALGLDELYKGTTKKLKVTRRVFDEKAGQSVPQSEILELQVKPGWKAGTKITYAGKGDVEPGRPADDLVFVVAEKRHRTFTRNGSDLATTLTIPLETALAGGTAQVDGLDGRAISVPLGPGPVQPGTKVLVRGKGMPISKTTAAGSKGDLHVTVNVVLPRLSDAAQQQVAALLKKSQA